jgi:hypothetical protein
MTVAYRSFPISLVSPASSNLLPMMPMQDRSESRILVAKTSNNHESKPFPFPIYQPALFAPASQKEHNLVFSPSVEIFGTYFAVKKSLVHNQTQIAQD